MSEQVWKYLPHVPHTVKKPLNFKRKSQVTDKEVLNLTGGLFPVKLIDAVDLKNLSQTPEKWVYAPIIQRNQKIGPIYHWVKQSEEKKIYHGDKFNVQAQVVQFTEQQFKLVNDKYPEYSQSRVRKIFELLKTYNINFIVVQDRLQEQISIEELKDIYFSVSRQILLNRGQKDHPLANYVFDKKYETNRKVELEKFMMRSKINNDQERFLINEIRRLQILIKKQQRQQINLKRALKLDEIPEEHFQVSITQQSPQQLRKSQKVYTRQQYLTKPLQLPGKIYDRLVQVLHGMNVPDRIVATEENQQLFDKLRKKILLMFSIQRYIRKKENEKRLLEDKKKKLLSGQDPVPTQSLPRKIKHPNK